MLCSICNKNLAVIFTKVIDGNKSNVEGYCYSCAKEKGINPLQAITEQADLSPQDLNDMSKQFESIFEDITENINMDELENSENMEGENVPFGTIIANIFGTKSNDKSEETSNSKKVKTEKRPKEKKKSFLDMYGTNLTNKAKNNKLDNVIGRDRELERIIQVLNRRSKNNPCLIGEPGVRQNCYCTGFSN